MTILVITTGGTIGAMPYFDPLSPPRTCTIPPDGRDIVRDELSTNFKMFPTRCQTMELQDSSMIGELYRQNIVDVIKSSPEESILITHGTDALLKTAEHIHQEAQTDSDLAAKRIILTGSMTPLSNGRGSDGFQNLHFALRQLSTANNNMTGINIVLSDFDRSNVWRPRLYAFRPNRYQKIYAPDGRYNRLIDTGNKNELSDILVRVGGLR